MGHSRRHPSSVRCRASGTAQLSKTDTEFPSSALFESHHRAYQTRWAFAFIYLENNETVYLTTSKTIPINMSTTGTQATAVVTGSFLSGIEP